MWNKATNIMQKGFDKEPVYDREHLNTKIKKI